MPFDPMKEMKKYQILQFNLLFQNGAEVQSSPPWKKKKKIAQGRGREKERLVTNL